MQAPKVSADIRRSPRRWGLGLLAVACVVGLMSAGVVAGKRSEIRMAKRAEKGMLIPLIASALSSSVTSRPDGTYVDISGRAPGGRVEALYPPLRPSLNFTYWSAAECPTDVTRRPCEAFRHLGVHPASPIWNSYGGTAGTGLSSAAAFSAVYGVPSPVGVLGEEAQWFAVVALDGNDSTEPPWIYTSWDKAVHLGH